MLVIEEDSKQYYNELIQWAEDNNLWEPNKKTFKWYDAVKEASRRNGQVQIKLKGAAEYVLCPWPIAEVILTLCQSDFSCIDDMMFEYEEEWPHESMCLRDSIKYLNEYGCGSESGAWRVLVRKGSFDLPEHSLYLSFQRSDKGKFKQIMNGGLCFSDREPRGWSINT